MLLQRPREREGGRVQVTEQRWQDRVGFSTDVDGRAVEFSSALDAGCEGKQAKGDCQGWFCPECGRENCVGYQKGEDGGLDLWENIKRYLSDL